MCKLVQLISELKAANESVEVIKGTLARELRYDYNLADNVINYLLAHLHVQVNESIQRFSFNVQAFKG